MDPAIGDLDVTDDLTIVGAGAETTVIDASGIDRVIQAATLSLLSDITLEITGASITGGDAGSAGGHGGGIWADNLVLVASRIHTKTAPSGAGGYSSSSPSP